MGEFGFDLEHYTTYMEYPYRVISPQLLAMTRKDLDIIVVGAGIGGKGHGFSFSNSTIILFYQDLLRI